MIEGEILTFSYRSSRSSSFTLGLGLVIVIETAVVHLWLHARHPVAAWCLTIVSLLGLVWLGVDYQRLGRGVISVEGGILDLRVGLRARAEVSLHSIEKVVRPTWRDLPAPGTAGDRGYRNLMKPASPNVLIVLTTAQSVWIANTVQISVRQIGLHLDDPDGFVGAISLAHATAQGAVI